MALDLFPIRTDDDHDRAVRLISLFWDAEEGSPEEAFMDALATLVDHYERDRWPIEPSTPRAYLKGFMALAGRTQAELAAVLGSRSRASEILSGKKDLTLDQIRKINRAWHVPVSCLVGELVDA